MNIKHQKVFTFEFPFAQGVVALSVPADTESEAADFLKKWMNNVQMELALQFPEVSPAQANMAAVASPELMPVELNKLQVSLLEDLVKACNLDVDNLAKSIKKATGLALTVNNFKAIVPALEALRDGKPLPNDKQEG